MDIFLDKSRDIIQIINKGEEIVKALTNLTPCTLSDITSMKFTLAGEGSYGKAIIVKPQGGKKEYVVKTFMSTIRFDECKPREEKLRIPIGGGKYIYPTYNELYKCPSNITEGMISIIVAELYKKGKCINYIDVYNFIICGKYPYIIQEKADITLSWILTCLTRDKYDNQTEIIYTSFLVQTLFALRLAYDKFQIVHGDIHRGNVMISLIEDEMWNGEYLKDATHFEYRYRGKSIYLPAVPFVVKIIDWGLACKFSQPQIISTALFTVDEKENVLISDNPSYDVLLFLMNIYTTVLETFGLHYKILDDMVRYACGLTIYQKFDYRVISSFRETRANYKFYTDETIKERCSLESLVFNSHIMPMRYLHKPSEEGVKIITLGTDE